MIIITNLISLIIINITFINITTIIWNIHPEKKFFFFFNYFILLVALKTQANKTNRRTRWKKMLLKYLKRI
jgi:hypothetical protein